VSVSAPVAQTESTADCADYDEGGGGGGDGGGGDGVGFVLMKNPSATVVLSLDKI